jgi:hypothetical protein
MMIPFDGWNGMVWLHYTGIGRACQGVWRKKLKKLKMGVDKCGRGVVYWSRVKET